MMPAPSPLLRHVGGFLMAALLLTGSLAPDTGAVGLFDGTYGGTTTIVRNNARIGSGEPLCSVTAVRGVFQVIDNTIQLAWDGSDWRGAGDCLDCGERWVLRRLSMARVSLTHPASSSSLLCMMRGLMSVYRTRPRCPSECRVSASRARMV